MNLDDKYLIIEDTPVPKAYWGRSIEDTGTKFKEYEITKDKPLLSLWPEGGATFTVKNGDPKNPILADNMGNVDQQLIISERLKKALEDLKVSDVEYLPVNVKEEEGKSLKITYYVAHFINAPDCIDQKASEAEIDPYHKDTIDKLKRLAFKEDPKRILFRPAHYRDVCLISWDAAEKLAEQGVSGVKFIPLFNHPHDDESKESDPINKKIAALNEKIANIKVEGLKPLAKAKVGKRIKMPIKALEDWLGSVKSKMFQASPGEDAWLDSYDAESYPAFDPSRYYCIGDAGDGDYYLLDLENKAAVVRYSHETGYNENDFEKVAKNWEEFKKIVEKKK